MSTTHSNTSTHRRLITAATMLVTVGAIAAGGLGTAASAVARPPGPRPPVPSIPAEPGISVQPDAPANSFRNTSAIAYGPNTGVWAIAAGSQQSPEIAASRALSSCQNAGGGNCVSVATVTNRCLALAVGEDNAVALNRWQGHEGGTKMEAMILAIDANGGGHIAAVACALPTSTYQSLQMYTGHVGMTRF